MLTLNSNQKAKFFFVSLVKFPPSEPILAHFIVNMTTCWRSLCESQGNFTWIKEASQFQYTVLYCQSGQVKLSDFFFLLSLQMGAVWNELQPKLGCLFGGNNGVKPPVWNLQTWGTEGEKHSSCRNAQTGKKEAEKLQQKTVECTTFLSRCKAIFCTIHSPFNQRIF